MTEEEWLGTNPDNFCFDPEPMLSCLQDTPSDRKLRLLAFASCSLVYERLKYPQSKKAIEVLGQFTEGLASAEELAAAAEGAWNAAASWSIGPESPSPDNRDEWNAFLDEWRLHEAIGWAVTGENRTCSVMDTVIATLIRLDTRWEPCCFIRCIFGNPFRPVSVNPSWLTSTVVALAEGIYQERAFDRLPILADALEEAGCDHADILNHCREPGEHVRGCWVVDLLTGRT